MPRCESGSGGSGSGSGAENGGQSEVARCDIVSGGDIGVVIGGAQV